MTRLAVSLCRLTTLVCCVAPICAQAKPKPAAIGHSQAFGVQRLPHDGSKRLGRVTVRRLRKEGFTKGVAVHPSKRGAIWIVAQEGVRDIAVARARNLLEFYLQPLPGGGPQEVARKQAVIARMIDNDAMLMMPTGAHREGHEPRLPAQPLYEFETPVDGSSWYLENNWEHRDAAFEEIFHLVHDTGIGTDQPGALPKYQAELDGEARRAMKDGRWGNGNRDVKEWLQELEDENSLAQEYIAAAIDTYYGLWGAFAERPGGMWGLYCAKDRDEQQRLDPRGQQLLAQFLPPTMRGYEALLDPEFAGVFHMSFDAQRPYTHKSRYLVEVRLTGSRSSGVCGNDEDNVLTGNAGNNELDGGGGHDVVVFRGKRAEYSVARGEGAIVVTDSKAGRDGRDRLTDIEILRFVDGDVKAAAIRRP